MTLSRIAEGAALLLAAALLASRSLPRPPLRPLAACLCTLAALDLARAAGPPRWADVAIVAAWWPCMALAVAVALWPAHARLLAAAALGWWLVELARVLGCRMAGAPLAAEWWALWAVGTAAQGVAVAVWARGAWRARRRPGEGAAVALVLAAGSAADGAGPWLEGASRAAARWEVGRWQSAATWGCVVGVCAWHWAREQREKKQR